MTVSMRFVCVFIAVLGLMGGPVAAQWGYGDGGVGYARRGVPAQALETPFSNGGSCVPMCVADATPCDPISYKLADRRCNVNQNGYFPK